MVIESNVNETASICGHQAKFMDVDGLRTRYYDVGDGEAMLLCHGGNPSGTSSANTWAPNLTGLGKRFRVLAADRLACGMTDNPQDKKDYTMAATVDHMGNFMTTLGLENVHMVGQSTGGYVAARLALEHRDKVKTLTIVDSATLGPPVGDFAQRRKILFAGRPDDTTSPTYFADRYRYHMGVMSYTTEHVTEEWIQAAAYMRGLPKAVRTAQDLGEADVNYFRETLPPHKAETHQWIREGRLHMPTLLYWGRNDPSAVFEIGVALFEMLSQTNSKVRMHVVNRAGHFHYREYPEEFNHNLISFIDYWSCHK
jgi:2-hydroxy-6-oxonona-2,4-dienedioate hydrolase